MDPSTLHQNLTQLVQLAQPYYTLAETEFNARTESLHFGLFCIVYSFLFLLVARVLLRPAPQWKARNKELKSSYGLTQRSGRRPRKPFTRPCFRCP